MTYSWCAAVLLLLAAGSCIVREPGTTVEITALSSAGSTPRALLINDRGYQIQLAELYFVLSRVELVACAGERVQQASIPRELFGPSIAYAHGTNSSITWSVPNVLAPLIDNAPVSIARLHPPAIAYCSLRVSLEAADADTERMPRGVDLNGLSMVATGSYDLEDTGLPGIPFSYRSFVSSSMHLTLVDQAGRPTPLVLSEDNLNVTLQIHIPYEHLFDGLTLYPGAFSSLGDLVLSQILTHASVVVSNE